MNIDPLMIDSPHKWKETNINCLLINRFGEMEALKHYLEEANNNIHATMHY